MCKRIFKSQTMPEGDVPFYKISTFGKEADAYISYDLYLEYKEKYSFPKESDILISASGTIGRTVIYDGQPAYFQDSNIMWLANDESKVLNSFLRYYYQVIEWPVSKGGTISRLYINNVENALVPLLSFDEQQHIVDILDRFDALTTSLTDGLPAEIEARRQQYEYYRNKLLSFPRKEG